jgi:inorganic pyrophosphatase
VSEPTFTGCGVLARPVAVLWLRDQGEREPKVVCVPCEDPNWEYITDVDELPEQLARKSRTSSSHTSGARTTRSRRTAGRVATRPSA